MKCVCDTLHLTTSDNVKNGVVVTIFWHSSSIFFVGVCWRCNYSIENMSRFYNDNLVLYTSVKQWIVFAKTSNHINRMENHWIGKATHVLPFVLWCTCISNVCVLLQCIRLFVIRHFYRVWEAHLPTNLSYIFTLWVIRSHFTGSSFYCSHFK